MTPTQAVERLRPGMRVMMPPGCGEPRALVAEICRQSGRLPDLTLMGGIHLGDYPCARPEWPPSATSPGTCRPGWRTPAAGPRRVRAGALLRCGHRVRSRRPLATRLRAGAHRAARRARLPEPRRRRGVALPAARLAPSSSPRSTSNAADAGDSTILDRGRRVGRDRPAAGPVPPPAIGEVERRIAGHVRRRSYRTGPRSRWESARRPRRSWRDFTVTAISASTRAVRLDADPSSRAASSPERATVATPGAWTSARSWGPRRLFEWAPREPAGAHGGLDDDPRSEGGGGPRAVRLDQLRDRDRPDRAGQRGGLGGAPGGGNRGPVRLRGGRGARRAARR